MSTCTGDSWLPLKGRINKKSCTEEQLKGKLHWSPPGDLSPQPRGLAGIRVRETGRRTSSQTDSQKGLGGKGPSRSHGTQAQLKNCFDCTEPREGLGGKGPLKAVQPNPLERVLLTPTGSSCSEPHPTWPGMLPGLGHLPPLWATPSRVSPPSV